MRTQQINCSVCIKFAFFFSQTVSIIQEKKNCSIKAAKNLYDLINTYFKICKKRKKNGQISCGGGLVPQELLDRKLDKLVDSFLLWMPRETLQ